MAVFLIGAVLSGTNRKGLAAFPLYAFGVHYKPCSGYSGSNQLQRNAKKFS